MAKLIRMTGTNISLTEPDTPKNECKKTVEQVLGFIPGLTGPAIFELETYQLEKLVSENLYLKNIKTGEYEPLNGNGTEKKTPTPPVTSSRRKTPKRIETIINNDMLANAKITINGHLLIITIDLQHNSSAIQLITENAIKTTKLRRKRISSNYILLKHLLLFLEKKPSGARAIDILEEMKTTFHASKKKTYEILNHALTTGVLTKQCKHKESLYFYAKPQR